MKNLVNLVAKSSGRPHAFGIVLALQDLSLRMKLMKNTHFLVDVPILGMIIITSTSPDP